MPTLTRDAKLLEAIVAFEFAAEVVLMSNHSKWDGRRENGSMRYLFAWLYIYLRFGISVPMPTIRSRLGRVKREDARALVNKLGLLRTQDITTTPYGLPQSDVTRNKFSGAFIPPVDRYRVEYRVTLNQSSHTHPISALLSHVDHHTAALPTCMHDVTVKGSHLGGASIVLDTPWPIKAPIYLTTTARDGAYYNATASYVEVEEQPRRYSKTISYPFPAQEVVKSGARCLSDVHIEMIIQLSDSSVYLNSLMAAVHTGMYPITQLVLSFRFDPSTPYWADGAPYMSCPKFDSVISNAIPPFNPNATSNITPGEQTRCIEDYSMEITNVQEAGAIRDVGEVDEEDRRELGSVDNVDDAMEIDDTTIERAIALGIWYGDTWDFTKTETGHSTI